MLPGQVGIGRRLADAARPVAVGAGLHALRPRRRPSRACAPALAARPCRSPPASPRPAAAASAERGVVAPLPSRAVPALMALAIGSITGLTRRRWRTPASWRSQVGGGLAGDARKAGGRVAFALRAVAARAGRHARRALGRQRRAERGARRSPGLRRRARAAARRCGPAPPRRRSAPHATPALARSRPARRARPAPRARSPRALHACTSGPGDFR